MFGQFLNYEQTSHITGKIWGIYCKYFGDKCLQNIVNIPYIYPISFSHRWMMWCLSWVLWIKMSVKYRECTVSTQWLTSYWPGGVRPIVLVQEALRWILEGVYWAGGPGEVTHQSDWQLSSGQGLYYDLGPLLLTWFNFNHNMDKILHPLKAWGEITYPFLNFNGCTVEVYEWISNFIPYFIMDVITYPCRD